jgi:hypothetical protein
MHETPCRLGILVKYRNSTLSHRFSKLGVEVGLCGWREPGLAVNEPAASKPIDSELKRKPLESQRELTKPLLHSVEYAAKNFRDSSLYPLLV